MITRLTALLFVSTLLAAAACQSRNSADAGSTVPPPAPGLVSHGDLAALLPTPDGWERTAPTSGLASLPAPATNATASYSRGKMKVDLEITDTGGAPEHVEAMSTVAGTSFSQEASNGYMKGTVFGGFPAIESWNHVDHVADLSILINGRFVVHASGTDVDKIETVRALVEQVDLKKIAGLGK
jgi:hypothetical protein